MYLVFVLYRYTAVAVLEMDFDRIDINQCPPGEGNSGPNRFADTARCKKDTTEVSLCIIFDFKCVVISQLLVDFARTFSKIY